MFFTLKHAEMNSSTVKPILGKDLRLEADKFFVLLEDGREIGVPYTWFPRSATATRQQLEAWRFIGQGRGIHWEALDEDISVAALLQHRPSAEEAA